MRSASSSMPGWWRSSARRSATTASSCATCATRRSSPASTTPAAPSPVAGTCSTTRSARWRRSPTCWSSTCGPAGCAGSRCCTTTHRWASTTTSGSTRALAAGSGGEVVHRASVSPLAADLAAEVAEAVGGRSSPTCARVPRPRRRGAGRRPGCRVGRLDGTGRGQLGAHVRLQPAGVASRLGGMGVRRHPQRRQPGPHRVAGDVPPPTPADRSVWPPTTSVVCSASAWCWPTTRSHGVAEGLERVKRVPAASGKAGTVMGFGQWDHAALKGDALVLRTWRDGRSVEV